MWNHFDTFERCVSHFWNVALIMFYFHRHCHLCSTSVFGGNSSDCTSWCHGNGNFYFHHRWDLDWTSDWPQVNLTFYHHTKYEPFLRVCVHKIESIVILCDFTESSWEKKSTGPSCSPPHVSQHSCSSWSCPGSQRARATCSSTKEMMRGVRKVNCSFHFIFIFGQQRSI